MRANLSGLFLLLLAQQGCAHPPTPVVLPNVGRIEPDPGPRYYHLPLAFRDHDVICEDVNQPGTCATVAEVRQFLNSRRAE